MTKGKPPLHNQPTTSTTTTTTTTHQPVRSSYIWTMAAHDMSGEASSDFFSPPPAVGGAVLPRKHDSSWIGARQSPIPSFDDEVKGATPVCGGDSDDDNDDDDDQDATKKYHRALHESLKKLDYFYQGRKQPQDETAHLLESGNRPYPQYSSINQVRTIPKGIMSSGKPKIGNKNNKNNKGPSRLHPLWNGASSEERKRNSRKYAKYYTKQRRRRKKGHSEGWKWGHMLVAVTGCYMLGTCIYDFSSWYQEQEGDIGLAHWSWFTLAQPRNANTIIRFGGMDLERILNKNEYWRLLSSQFMCGSIPEWILLYLSWDSVIYNNTTFRPTMFTWSGTFFAAALVGQLWMMAWDHETQTATAVTWGTCGVLTSCGIDRPNQRDLCFLTATCLVILACWDLPCNSVFGATGASFFGWLLSATATPDRLLSNHTPRPSSHVRFVLLLTLVLAPTLTIAFRPTDFLG